jgi:hypothetical protein
VRWLRNVLGVLLAFCLVLRIGAWLIAPLLPVLSVLLLLAAGLTLVVNGRSPK